MGQKNTSLKGHQCGRREIGMEEQGGGSRGAGKGREGRREEGKHGGEGRLDGWVVDGEELHEIRYI